MPAKKKTGKTEGKGVGVKISPNEKEDGGEIFAATPMGGSALTPAVFMASTSAHPRTIVIVKNSLNNKIEGDSKNKSKNEKQKMSNAIKILISISSSQSA